MDRVRTRHHLDGDNLIIQKTQDIAPVIEHARTIRENHRSDARKFIASVPNTLYYELLAEAEKKGIWEPGVSGSWARANRWIADKVKTDEYRLLRGL